MRLARRLRNILPLIAVGGVATVTLLPTAAASAAPAGAARAGQAARSPAGHVLVRDARSGSVVDLAPPGRTSIEPISAPAHSASRARAPIATAPFADRGRASASTANPEGAPPPRRRPAPKTRPAAPVTTLHPAASAAGSSSSGSGHALQTPVAMPGPSLNGEIGMFNIFHWPADLQIGVSSSNVVSIVNSSIWVYARTGGLVGAQDSATFFNAPTSPKAWYLSDPQVRFDATSGRWFITAMSYDQTGASNGNALGGQVYLAVSATASPIGAWTHYVLAQNTTGLLYDQPFLAVDQDKVVVSWNDYQGNFSGTSFVGQETWVIQKSSVIAASPHVPAVSLFGAPDTSRFRIVPVQQEAPSTTAEAVYNREQSTGQALVGFITITGTPLQANVTYTETDLPMNPTPLPPSADQPNGLTASIATNDDRFISAISSGTTTWLAGNDGCTPAGDRTTRPCMRLVAVTTSASPAVAQDFDVGVAGAGVYYPALVLDRSGDLYVTYTMSSTSLDPSAEIAVQVAGSAAGTLTDPETIQAGQATYDNNQGVCGGAGGPSRWGDYTGAAADPAAPQSVWLAATDAAASSLPETQGCAWASEIVQATVVPTTASDPYHPLTPTRICDTRTGNGVAPNQCNGNGAAPGTLTGGSTLTVTVAGHGGVPASASAAVMNVTVADTTATSYLTVWPSGAAMPLASNLNWTAGRVVPNLVQVPLGAAGAISVFNATGSADVIVDVAGYFAPSSGTDGRFNPLAPSRICDTRPPQQDVASNQCNAPGAGALGAGTVLAVHVAGHGGVPANGAEAVVLNVTAVGPTAPSTGYLTVYPQGPTRPTASDLNFHQGQTIANRVVVPLNPANGEIDIYNFTGTTNVVVDVNGWYSSTSATTGSLFTGSVPVRICDTRAGSGVEPNQCDANGSQPLQAGQAFSVQVGGTDGVPANAVAVVCNVTVTAATQRGYLTVSPPTTSVPVASDVNWAAGETVPNLVVVQLGANGAIQLYNALGQAQVVVDLIGWYA